MDNSNITNKDILSDLEGNEKECEKGWNRRLTEYQKILNLR